MKPTVYIETTIPSLLTAWPSRDVEIAAQQLATREWREKRRETFDLYISAAVLAEVARGDAIASAARQAALAECAELAIDEEVRRVEQAIMAAGVIPPRARTDALHIAIAARWRIDFLLTWNCRHINNAVTIRDIEAACRAAGLSCDWPTLKARAVAVDQMIPGYQPGDGMALPEAIRGSNVPETLRAWANLYAPELISETAEQPQDWLWW